MKCIFSVDVEDWFHILDIPSTPDLSLWEILPSSVEKNFFALLDLFSETNTRSTCFFIGWVAQRFPHLVGEAVSRGHEIASHGYAHRLVYQMSPREFYDDAVKSRLVLEELTGAPVLGYRSAGFSVTEQTPWFFECLMKAGFRYDSSVFPAPRGHGGMKNHNLAPYVIANGEEALVEFPMTVAEVWGRKVCVFGGGYLRLAPLQLIRKLTRSVLESKERPVIFYIHPREIDPHHPRLSMSLHRRFKSYVNLTSTEPKIRNLLASFEFTRFDDFLRDHFSLLDSPNVKHAAVGESSEASKVL